MVWASLGLSNPAILIGRCLGTFLVVTTWKVGALLATTVERPGMLLSILQHTDPLLLIRKNDLAPNVNNSSKV